MSDDEVSQAIQNLRADTIAEVRGCETPLSKAADELESVYDEHSWITDIVPQSNVHLDIDEFKRMRGQCQYNRKTPNGPAIEGHYCIRLNERLFTDGDYDWQNTLRHELAHVICYEKHGESQDHNDNWKQMARRVGAEGTRTGQSLNGIEDYPYYIGCPDCELQWGRHRRSSRVQDPSTAKCPHCDVNVVAWEQGQPRPTTPGVSTVDCRDL